MAHSYRIVMHADLQNRKIVNDSMREEDQASADEILSNFKNIIVHPGINVEEATMLSREFSIIDDKNKDSFTPNDFIYREFGEVVYCHVSSNGKRKIGVGNVKYLKKELVSEFEEIERELFTNKEHQ